MYIYNVNRGGIITMKTLIVSAKHLTGRQLMFMIQLLTDWDLFIPLTREWPQHAILDRMDIYVLNRAGRGAARD